MTPPTDLTQLLPYLVALLAPYLISGTLISQFAEQLPFIHSTDPQKKEWPDFAKVVFVGGICWLLSIAHDALTGQFASGITAANLNAAISAGTLLAAGTQVWHLGRNNFVPSLLTFVIQFVATIGQAIGNVITSIIHPREAVPAVEDGKG